MYGSVRGAAGNSRPYLFPRLELVVASQFLRLTVGLRLWKSRGSIRRIGFSLLFGVFCSS